MNENLQIEIHRLGDILKTVAEPNYWSSLIQVFIVLVPSIATAFLAAFATVYFQNRNSRKIILSAIKIEIDAITNEISRVENLGSPNNEIECEIISRRLQSAPIYSSNASFLSLMDERIAKSIVEFYLLLITVPELNSRFSKQDLKIISDKGKAILAEK